MPARLIYNQYFLLPALLILTAVGTYCAIRAHWFFFAACLLGDAIAIARLLALYKQNSRKVAFMLDAINNNDFTFKYPMTGRSADDQLVSETLTQIAQILSRAKAETIQQEKYYELILDSVKTGIIVIDERGFIYQKNREALRLLGITVLTHPQPLPLVRQYPARRERSGLFYHRTGNNAPFPPCLNHPFAGKRPPDRSHQRHQQRARR